MSYSSTFDACCGEILVAANTQTKQILWAEKFMTKRLTSNGKFWAETLERCQLITFCRHGVKIESNSLIFFVSEVF